MGAILLARQQFTAISNDAGWDESLRRICGDYTTVWDETTPFFGETELRAVDGLAIAHVASNAHSITRSRAQASISDDEELFLIGCVSGSARMVQQREEFLVKAGDLALIDSGLPSEFTLAGPCSFMSLGIPRRMLASRVGARTVGSPVRIAGQGIGYVLMSLLISTYDQAAQLGEADARAAEESLLVLLQRALCPQVDPSYMTDRSDTELYSVQQLILTMLAEPDLSPDLIARRYRTSTRRLHRLFESAGLSLGAWVRRARLERCRRDLANPRLADHRVTSIAFKWGFNEASHFSRAFRDEFGLPPREFRRQALSTCPDAKPAR